MLKRGRSEGTGSREDRLILVGLGFNITGGQNNDGSRDRQLINKTTRDNIAKIIRDNITIFTN